MLFLHTGIERFRTDRVTGCRLEGLSGGCELVDKLPPPMTMLMMFLPLIAATTVSPVQKVTALDSLSRHRSARFPRLRCRRGGGSLFSPALMIGRVSVAVSFQAMPRIRASDGIGFVTTCNPDRFRMAYRMCTCGGCSVHKIRRYRCDPMVGANGAPRLQCLAGGHRAS